MTHDYDWAGRLKRSVPGLVEVRFGRGSYFKVPREAMFLLARDSMASVIYRNSASTITARSYRSASFPPSAI